MGEGFTRKPVIIRASLNATPQCETTKKPWQEIAFERMGIKPGVCNCCGGRMIIIQTIPNQFAPGKRAPPIIKKTNESLSCYMAE